MLVSYMFIVLYDSLRVRHVLNSCNSPRFEIWCGLVHFFCFNCMTEMFIFNFITGVELWCRFFRHFFVFLLMFWILISLIFAITVQKKSCEVLVWSRLSFKTPLSIILKFHWPLQCFWFYWKWMMGSTRMSRITWWMYVLL